MRRAELAFFSGMIWMGLGIAHHHSRLTFMGALLLPLAVYLNHRDNRRDKGKTPPGPMGRRPQGVPPKVPPPPPLPKG